MRLRFTYGLLAFFFGICLLPQWAQATHVRAGEITTRRLSATSLTYEITLTAYYDEGRGQAAADAANEVLFCFGDGTSAMVARGPRTYINGRTSSINIYRTTHTFPGPNAYTIGAQIINRNENTLNLRPGGVGTQDISFYVSTTILINAGLGLNSTPVMLNLPLDSARIGQTFCHNPAAYDADGDSLAYRLSIPKQALQQGACQSINIGTYQDPTKFSTSAEGGGTPTFSIDPRTGQLCWDAPGQAGQFNFAFIVEEWRNGVLIGEVTRDMQIIVVDSKNQRPRIIGADLCVVAGTLINQAITATDPDGQRVLISAYGGPLNRNSDGQPLPASIRPTAPFAQLINGNVPLNQPGTATFNWQTTCDHVRNEPYEITLKVQDVPPRGTPYLASFATLMVRVIAPAVQNVTARPTVAATGRAIQLNWSAYTCGRIVNTGLGLDTTQLIVYRREGCTPIQSNSCTTGIPAGAGFQEVGQVPYTATTFLDTTALRRGINYSYVIVARNPGVGNNGGLSLMSAQTCVELPLLMPVMTQVTVDSTSDTRGRITVRWTRPLGIASSDLGGPYQYRLQRATGQDGTDFTTIATINSTLQAVAADTVYIDRGLNTTANSYRYRIQFYYTNSAGQLTALDVTDAAASVRLNATPGNRQVVLTWQANTPWSNDNQRHDVYRSRSGPNGPFNKIAEVAVTTAPYSFTDTGNDTYTADGNTSLALSADSSYCYRVMTRGRYTDAKLATIGLLENYSQIICASPSDTTRPCPPVLGLDSLNCANLNPDSFCNQTTFTNKLHWRPTLGPTCDPNIASYKIYYARYEQDSLTALTSVPAPTLTFDHNSLTTTAGCYVVTAVSRRGLESKPSNKVCNNVCPNFALPNVFTPNGDGHNDTFEPLRCPSGIASVQFIVFNRYGAKVYESNGPTLSWNGRTTDGTELPNGLYYYQANVQVAGVSRTAPVQVYKGWVQILREK